ncbi:MAG: hypothetical protein IJU76_13135 [Desulfovibrionaceae bacterium]|nr:hypothetical protein [Desulfovibrionaceae bacterium]
MSLLLSEPLASDARFTAYLSGSLSYLLLNQQAVDRFSPQEDLSTAQLARFSCKVGSFEGKATFMKEVADFAAIQKALFPKRGDGKQTSGWEE